MSRELKSQRTKTDYSQAQEERRQSVQIGSGATVQKSSTGATGKQTSAGTTSQVSEGSSTQLSEGATGQASESLRDLTSKSLRTGTTEEKANIGFEISFTVKITGKIPQLNGHTANC